MGGKQADKAKSRVAIADGDVGAEDAWEDIDDLPAVSRESGVFMPNNSWE